MNPWSVLDIEVTHDKKLIKRAYIKKLKKCHPEEDQQAFIELREAYETALATSAHQSIVSEAPNSLHGHAAEIDTSATIDDETNTNLELPVNLDRILENFEDYSELRNTYSKKSNQDDEIDFDQEYQNCLQLLDKALTDNGPENLENWKNLFANRLFYNHNFRNHFCTNLIDGIKVHIKTFGHKNLFTPELILLIEEFISGTHGIERNYNILDQDLLTISTISERAKMILGIDGTQNKTVKAFIFDLIWMIFSFRGRLSRKFFILTIATLLIVPVILINQLTPYYSQSELNRQQSVTNILDYEIDPETTDEVKLDPLDFNLLTSPDSSQSEVTIREEASTQVNKKTPMGLPAVNDSLLSNGYASLKNSTGSFARLVSVFLLVWAILAIIIKRLHDTGYSFMYIFVIFIPYIGVFWLLKYLLSGPEKKDNKYGKYVQRSRISISKFKKLVAESFVFDWG